VIQVLRLLPYFIPGGNSFKFCSAKKTTVLIDSEATFVRTMGSRRMKVDLAWSVKRSGSGFRIYNILVVRIPSKLPSLTLTRSSTMYSQHSPDSLNTYQPTWQPGEQDYPSSRA
jgi:hypothetical protein